MSVSFSQQRILSLWLKRLSTDRLWRQAQLRSPVVVYGKRGNLELVIALDEAADELGISSGLVLAQVRAMHPDIVAIEENAGADAQLLEKITDWCLRYTPLIICDPPDGVLLDIAGCAHLYGGEQKLVDDLNERLAGHGLTASIAVAGTIGAAWAAARYGQPGLHKNGDERALLASLPVAALRLPGDIIAALKRVGLKRIGDLADLPRAPLAARFGTDLLRQLDRALGHEHEPLNPRLPIAPYLAEQRFAEPIARGEDVLAIIGKLAARLIRALELRGDGARRIELTLFRTDGALRRIAVGTSRPLRNSDDIRALFGDRLAALADEYDPGFGFDMARLSVVVAAPCPPEQIGIGNGEDAAALDRLVDHLSARLGSQRVRRLVAQDSHIPELAAVSLPAQSKPEPGWDAYRRAPATAEIGPRPLRMLARPEPVEAMAEVPDGPPKHFRWRRVLHEVVAAEGPERIEGAWWSEDGGNLPGNLARDYFRVEDKNGLRFWLFRAGLYRNPTDKPCWFLHGLFA